MYQGSSSYNISCYDCAEKFKLRYRETDCVGNPTASLSPRRCQDHEGFCSIEYTKVNRVITKFERNCKADCQNGSIRRGFGLDEELRTICCATNGCNLGSSAPPPLVASAVSINTITLISGFVTWLLTSQ
ncbi:uncharacterized protein [Diadema antillarum]|uniref:uncharacterized protein n=1 Tax=Diadema antillarum TaxID=105358 RepID=UPI003A88816E